MNKFALARTYILGQDYQLIAKILLEGLLFHNLLSQFGVTSA
jgi:hypothetical protein